MAEMNLRELGACNATVVGHLIEDPVQIADNGTYQTRISAVRSRKMPNGNRVRRANVLAVTVSGTAAEAMLRGYRYGRKVFISGELTIDAEATIHAAQFLWTDGDGGV